VKKLEAEIAEYLNCENLLFIANGTLALQLAIKALNIQGEVITTPFSYVATTSSIVWEGGKAVFVDVLPDTLNIDPNKIEEKITDKTSAILATHCFGNACDIEAIEKIADKHQLRVIYDAAHCFGTLYKGKCIFEFGDISTCSLHATKIMHSIEGGLLISKNREFIERLAFMRNFGHDGYEKFNGVGINAKNSEVHAAMGLCVLEDIDLIRKKRQEQSETYDQLLSSINLDKIKIQADCTFNYAYYPIIFRDEAQLKKVTSELESKNIFPRRYFYPSLSSLDYVKRAHTPISDDYSSRILCLPLYHELLEKEQKLIANIIKKVLTNEE